MLFFYLFIVVLLGLGLIYSLVTVVHCVLNGAISRGGKVLWILAMLPLLFPPAIYGFLHFSSRIGRICTIVYTLILLPMMYYYDFGKKLNREYDTYLVAAIVAKDLHALPDSAVRRELMNNYQILKQEMHNPPSSERDKKDLALLAVMHDIIVNRLKAKDVQTWRSVYYYRQTLTLNYMMALTEAMDPKRNAATNEPR